MSVRAPLTCIAALLLAAPPCRADTQGRAAPNQGEVRCFCNLPDCVSTGYMCKSQGPGCFSDLTSIQDVHEALYGCVDMLERRRQQQCEVKAGTDVSVFRLRCCHRDMCNHIDSPEIRYMYNDSFLGSMNSSETTHLYLNNLLHTNSNEVWFKAATIAVPICGAVILLVLVGLALRILRKEHDRLARHGVLFPSPAARKQPQHFERNVDVFSKKVPLLFQHQNEVMGRWEDVGAASSHRFDKNATNAKLNSADKQCGIHTDYSLLVPLHRDLNLHKTDNVHSNLYRNVNLTFVAPTRATHAGGKCYDKHHVTSWGTVAQSASHV